MRHTRVIGGNAYRLGKPVPCGRCSLRIGLRGLETRRVAIALSRGIESCENRPFGQWCLNSRYDLGFGIIRRSETIQWRATKYQNTSANAAACRRFMSVSYGQTASSNIVGLEFQLFGNRKGPTISGWEVHAAFRARDVIPVSTPSLQHYFRWERTLAEPYPRPKAI